MHPTSTPSWPHGTHPSNPSFGLELSIVGVVLVVSAFVFGVLSAALGLACSLLGFLYSDRLQRGRGLGFAGVLVGLVEIIVVLAARR